jgi:hypothetical protein
MNIKASTVLILSGFMLFVLACGAVGAVSTQPPQATNTSAPPPTETTIPTKTPIPATPTPKVQQFFTENFQGDSIDNWFYFLRSGDESKFSISVESDGLLFELSGQRIFSYVVYDAFEYEEVRVDATVENQGVNDNNITLFCRYSEENGWYEFNIYSSGLYDMYFTKPDPSGNLNYGLIAEGGSNNINMGQAVNEYGISCKKDSLTLFINGEEARSVGIPNYVLENGKVGVSVSSFGQVPVKVLVQKVEISEP